jgi:hypothetical protein
MQEKLNVPYASSLSGQNSGWQQSISSVVQQVHIHDSPSAATSFPHFVWTGLPLFVTSDANATKIALYWRILARDCLQQ